MHSKKKIETQLQFDFLFIAIIIFLFLILSVALFSQTKYELKCNNDLLDKSRNVLYKQVGVVEKTGNNDGVMVERYLKSVGLSKGNPYCAAGQYWCFYISSDSNIKIIPIKRTGLANGMFNDAMNKGKRVDYIPKINDLVVWKKYNAINGHIERIIAVQNNGYVTTIGFNTSNNNKGSQNNGQGVYIKKRNVKHPLSRVLLVRGIIGFCE